MVDKNTRHAVPVSRILTYGHYGDGAGMAILFTTPGGDELVLRVPYSEASSLVSAVQAAEKAATLARGERTGSTMSTALEVEAIALGPTDSGRVGMRFSLSNKTKFEFVASKSVVKQLYAALHKYTEYKDSGGPERSQ